LLHVRSDLGAGEKESARDQKRRRTKKGRKTKRRDTPSRSRTFDKRKESSHEKRTQEAREKKGNAVTQGLVAGKRRDNVQRFSKKEESEKRVTKAAKVINAPAASIRSQVSL